MQAFFAKPRAHAFATGRGLRRDLFRNEEFVPAFHRRLCLSGGLLRFFLHLGIDAEAVAFGARAHRAVERKRTWLGCGVTDAAVGTRESLGHEGFLAVVTMLALNQQKAVAEFERELDGLADPGCERA